jgi:hypothetical protein
VTCYLVRLAKEYSGLGLLTFSSSISKYFFEELLRKMFPYSSFSFPCCMVFNNCMVCSGFPYSYLLFRMCNAYAETRLFVLIYLCVHGELKWTKYYFV